MSVGFPDWDILHQNLGKIRKSLQIEGQDDG